MLAVKGDTLDGRISVLGCESSEGGETQYWTMEAEASCLTGPRTAPASGLVPAEHWAARRPVDPGLSPFR